MMKQRMVAAGAALLAAVCGGQETWKTNWPGRYPARGIEIPAAVRSELETGVAKLGADIAKLHSDLKDRPDLFALLPDVQIFHNAVRYAIEDQVFFKSNEFAAARALLTAGHERAAQLRAGEAPWLAATGNVVRGFVSSLDGSVQPYGIVVPAEFKRDDGQRRRLDIWFHGRGDTQSEVNFLTGRSGPNAKSEFLPPDAFVLHPYGRFMNAFHFAGEVDAWEALAHARSHYGVDDRRVAARGFSMGGAAAWHFGAHHAGEFCAVNPGAGFADVPVYMKVAAMTNQPAWYEQRLWLLYDATNYAANFFNTTLVAYSGELDKQKLAADCMDAALAGEGMKMTHIIGPNTAHKYEAKAREDVARLVDAAAARGSDPLPAKVRFVLFSLRFNRMKWITVDGLERHWERSTVEGEFDGTAARLVTKGVTGVTLALPQGTRVTIDGTAFAGPLAFVKREGRWTAGTAGEAGAKRHGLQGAIDDAFVEPFLFVLPTGTPLNEKAGSWAKEESDYARRAWRHQHRGEPRIKNDAEVTADDIGNLNLVVFGDPQSNRLLAKMADRLPIRWSDNALVVNGKRWPADRHAPVFIVPNPLNPRRYVVVNSGFTYALVGGGSNAGQTPKLPDWAVLDMTVPLAERIQRGVADAGFFGEDWRFRPGR